jgi:uridine phosphorylase
MSSEEPLVGGKVYHLMVSKGDVSRYVLLPGDPERVPLIARYWDRSREVARHREYVVYTGIYRDAEISAVSTGIGGPSTAIAIEELLRVGSDTFIRVGTTGTLRKDIEIGDLIITHSAIRFDGASKAYVYPEYPASSSYEIVLALVEAAETLGVRYHVGITASSDSFYVGQGRPGYNGYKPYWVDGLINDLKKINVLNFEMEAATILTLANIYGARAGAICAVIANRETGEFKPGAGVDAMIKVANEAVRLLHEWDRLKAEKGKRYLSLSLIK